MPIDQWVTRTPPKPRVIILEQSMSSTLGATGITIVSTIILLIYLKMVLHYKVISIRCKCMIYNVKEMGKSLQHYLEH